MKCYYLSFLWVLIFGLQGLQSQTTLYGELNFDDGLPAEGAIVRLLQADSSQMISYTEADQNGNWELTTQLEKEVVLEFSFFGYRKEYRRIADPTNFDGPLEVTLQQESFDLDAVTVKDRAFGVQRSGDTLSFRLETFTTGAERTLGDVLNRLPGMEIRDGSVYYGGERINKLLVQGRDIINENHQLATEGIRADQLKEIKVIENYKEPEQKFQTEQSDQTAMDVRLKDNELNKWSGEAEVLGGYPASVKAEVDAFNLGDKVGLSGFARGNNVGERILTFRDMMDMVSQQGGRRFHFSTSSLVNLVPSELNISDQVQANMDGILNLNADIDLTENMKLKGFVMGAFARRESDVFRQINYLAEDQVRTENQSRTSETPVGNTMWKLEWDVDSLTFIEASLPFTVNTSSITDVRMGKFDQADFNTTNENESLSYSFSPFAKMRRQFREEDLLQADMRFQYSRENVDQLFQDVFPFLALPPSSMDSIYLVMQDQQISTLDAGISASYKAMFGDWYLEPGGEYSYQEQMNDFDANQSGVQDFSLSDRFFQHAANVRLKGGYETSDWEVSPSITVNYLQRNAASTGEFDNLFPGYGLDVVRKFNRAHNLRLSGSYGLQYPSFNRFWDVYDISSSTEVATGGYPFDLATKGYSASLRYRNFIVTRRTFIFGSISYNYNEDVVTNYTESFGNYILSGYLPTPASESVGGYFFMGYELPFFPIRLEPRVNVNWSDGFSTNAKEEFPSQNFSQSYGFEIESRWDFPLNVELEINYNNNQVSTDDREPIVFESWAPSLELECKLDNWRMEVDFEYDRAGTRQINSDLYILDFEMTYDLKNLPIVLRLQADNVLNLDPRERVRNSFNLNVSQVSRYRIFPGFILGGISFQF